MAAYDPKLQGVAALTRQLKALGKLEDGKAIRAGVRAGGRIIAQRAQALIPKGIDPHKTYKGRHVAPGFASRNIRYVTWVDRSKQRAHVRVGVTNEAFYAVNFVELGTSKMAKQPWLRPAFDSTIDAQKEAMEKALRRAVERAVKTR